MSNINMLCSLMMDWILSHTNSTSIVTHKRNCVDVHSKIFQVLPDPQQLRTTGCGSYIFSFSSWKSHRVLLLGTLRDKWWSKEMSHSRGTLPVNLITSKISICITNQIKSVTCRIEENQVPSFLQVSENTFCSLQMWITRTCLEPSTWIETISGLLAVRYNKDPMIPLYMVWFTRESYSSAISLEFVPTGVSIGFESNILNFFSNSLMYFYWLIEIPFDDCLICRPRKNVSSPIMLISNSFPINAENSSHKCSEVASKIISST